MAQLKHKKGLIMKKILFIIMAIYGLVGTAQGAAEAEYGEAEKRILWNSLIAAIEDTDITEVDRIINIGLLRAHDRVPVDNEVYAGLTAMQVALHRFRNVQNAKEHIDEANQLRRIINNLCSSIMFNQGVARGRNEDTMCNAMHEYFQEREYVPAPENAMPAVDNAQDDNDSWLRRVPMDFD
jgi:hypothetical protein